MEYFTLKLCGLTRKLPLTFVGKHTQLASFSMLGEVELVKKIATVLAKKIRPYDFDYLVGPEVKVVPLIYELARRLDFKRFVICRKSVKPYMVNPVILKPLPYFPKHVKQLVINGNDAEILKGKRVVIIDDVVSTGVTLRMMHQLMEKIEAKVVLTMVVLKQGEQFDKIDNLIFLEELPIFKSP